MNFFNIFKSTIFEKNSNSKKERKPLKLPLFPDNKKDVFGYRTFLESNIPIWAWSSLADKPNYTALNNCREGFLDGFACYRKEKDLLLEYIGIISPNYELQLKLERIWSFTNSNILSLLETEFENAYKIYYDPNPKEYTDALLKYMVTLEYDSLIMYLKTHDVYILKDDDYKKKVIE